MGLKDMDLPQYEDIFRKKNVDGKCIPRMATDKSSFLQKELGISNAINRKKIHLRASEIILFGPVHKVHFFGDKIVLLTVLIASLLCFYAFHQKRISAQQIGQLQSDMEFLKQSEQQLKELQENVGATVSKERELELREEIEAAKKETDRLVNEQGKHEQEKTKL